MKIFHEYNNNVISSLVEMLKEGKVIAFPTETVFGLMCDATKKESCERIFEIKRRPDIKILGCTFPSSFLQSENFILNKNQKLVFQNYIKSPPATILSKIKSSPWNLKNVTSDQNEVGVRVTNFPPFLDLVNKFEKPIAQTSMNISGESVAKTPSKFLSQLEKLDSSDNLMPDFCLEIIIPPNLPSKVIRILESGEIERLR